MRWWGLRIRVGSLVCLLISCCVPCVTHGRAVLTGIECFAMLGLFCLIAVTHPVGSISSFGKGDAWVVVCAAAVLAWSALMGAIVARCLVRKDEARKVLVAACSALSVVSVVGVFLASACLVSRGYVGDVTMHGGSYLWAISLCGLATVECLDGGFDADGGSSTSGGGGRIPSNPGVSRLLETVPTIGGDTLNSLGRTLAFVERVCCSTIVRQDRSGWGACLSKRLVIHGPHSGPYKTGRTRTDWCRGAVSGGS